MLLSRKAREAIEEQSFEDKKKPTEEVIEIQESKQAVE
jgi:hypothetical protein